MAEPVEVAIEYALLARAVAFAQLNSLTISLPNIAFTPPAISPTAQYLRAYLIPAPTVGLGIEFESTDRHKGIFQIDVFQGAGGGEIASRRLAASVVSYFPQGTELTSGGFTIRILDKPYLGPLMMKPADPWTMLPVRIAYYCFD